MVCARRASLISMTPVIVCCDRAVLFLRSLRSVIGCAISYMCVCVVAEVKDDTALGKFDAPRTRLKSFIKKVVAFFTTALVVSSLSANKYLTMCS